MAIGDDLENLNIISGDRSKEIFNDLYTDILNTEINRPSQFCDIMWSRFQNSNHGSNNINGKIFEGILAVIFYKEGIRPIFVQAKLAFIPNVNFDFIAYTQDNGPIILSAKTSLRERYKQADLEGMMLRQVHRKAKSYLITMEHKEARSVNAKIKKGEVLGIDEVIVANANAFDNLINDLKNYQYIKPDKINIITSQKIIEEL